MTKPSVSFSIVKPAVHGEICIEPSLCDMVKSIDRNRDLFSASELSIAGETLSSFRTRCRAELLEIARNYTSKWDDKIPKLPEELPLIVTGHQCQFNHCGVFMKYILLSHLAKAQGSIALNLVVDSDITKDAHLKLPANAESGLETYQLDLEDVDPDLPMEYQPLPTPDEFEDIIDQLELLDVPTALDEPVDIISQELQNSYKHAESMVDLLTGLNRQLARQLDLNWLDLPVSLMSKTASFMDFATDLIFQPIKVWQCYNDALKTFRQHEKIKDPTHPMPDLMRGNKNIEMPFWAFHEDQEREPFIVKIDQDDLSIQKSSGMGVFLNIPKTNDSEKVTTEELSELLKKHNVELRPRALTLTIFTRLFLADYFIHGIGGAYYDRVVDDFITQFYGLTPPTYACTSATMHLSLGDIPSVSDVKKTINHLEHQLRDLQYNPQRYISNSQKTPKITDLLEQRAIAITQCTKLKETQGPHQDRKGNFDTIQKLNAKLAKATKNIAKEITQQISTAQQQLQQATIAHDREYFFGLFQSDELKILQTKLKAEVNLTVTGP